MTTRARGLLVALILTALWSGLVGFGHLRGDMAFIERIEASVVDLRTTIRGVRAPPDIATIVAIDDEAVRMAGRYPLPREQLATIVSRIASMKPKAIALDILLIDKGPEDGDAALAGALGASPGVIAAAGTFRQAVVTASEEGPLAFVSTADSLLLPLDRFAQTAEVGIANVGTDQSGTPRTIPLLFRSPDRIDLALPLKALVVAAGSDPVIEPGRLTVGERTIATDFGQAMPLSFYGPRGTIRTVSAARLLSGDAPAAAFRDRFVVLGASVTGGGDVFPTPFDQILPGVEVMATALVNMASGQALVRDAAVRRIDAALGIALALALVGLLAWRRDWTVLALIVVILVLFFAGNFFAFTRGIWLSVAVPVTAAGPPLALFAGAQVLAGRRRSKRLAAESDLLQRVQAPGFSRLLARDPTFLAQPREQHAAVVFLDLSGFTGISERLGAARTRDVLDDFYKLVDEEAEACGGAVTSFTGDGAMILFGLPAPAPGDAAHAAECCLNLCRRVETWLDASDLNAAAKGFKIGAHFGTLIASRLGRGSNQHITTTGDTVNVASRLMGIAGAKGVLLAVSDSFFRAAGAAAFREGRISGPVETPIRGRAESVVVWLWDPPARSA